MMKKFFLSISVGLLLVCSGFNANAQVTAAEEQLGPGDAIRIKVYQNPDLSLDTNINDNGAISFPLIRTLKFAGFTLPQAESAIEKALQVGGFIEKPQVTVNLVQLRRAMVYALGEVARPGQFPLERKGTRLSELLATIGGISQSGASTVIVNGTRAGQAMRKEININEIFLEGKFENDMVLADGDVLFVGRAPVFYIYGEAQRPGSFKIERGMNFTQALVMAGGPTAKGTERNMRVTRRTADGKLQDISPAMSDLVQADDVIFIRETLF